MNKYKIGDKVKLTDDINVLDEIYLHNRFAGKTITITAIKGDKYYFNSEHMYNWYVKEKQIVGFAKIFNWKEVVQNAQIQRR